MSDDESDDAAPSRLKPRRRRRERGRGDRVLDGLWRLRLPLPWPGVPHGNSWAVRSCNGIVLFDTGIHEEQTDEHPSSWSELEHAMGQVGLRPSDINLVVCTHAHADHYGQAAPIVDLTGSELWMHPDHAHTTKMADPEGSLQRRMEVAMHSGVPEKAIQAYQQARRSMPTGVAEAIEPDRDRVPGDQIDTDLGTWEVHYTPGHAPSHVTLHQPDRGLLLSGDHLIGRVTLYFDHGWSEDPVAEFLSSLDTVEQLDAGLCLAGHGRPFRDIQAHIDGNRAEVESELVALRERMGDGAQTAFELLPPDTPPAFATWRLTLTLCFLEHLEKRGEASRETDHDGTERWSAVAS
ncbi:MAG: MBL fold metallo-hydrolase [Solirubrobacterales bacterium]